jgi:predicted CXXCH cytochrome family protein
MYLWNKKLSKIHYTPYQSSTLYAKIGQPTGASKLCLSCHDGTIALGDVLSERHRIPFAGGIRFIPEGPTRIGTDLSDDHPVSFVYDDSLAVINGELAFPSTLPREMKLDSQKELQCTTCHDAHNNIYGDFLVMPNENSAMCIICHQKRGWNETSHSLSEAEWNGIPPDPWPDTQFRTVDSNGCDNCHDSHTAEGQERLMNYSYEEDNCIVCHNGNVSSINIEQELVKPFTHAVQDYNGIHDPTEDFLSEKKKVKNHVECSDCHNPHQSNPRKSPGAPKVPGALIGVTGISVSGQKVDSAANEYEICFKCHGDNNVINSESITRDLQQLNTRLEFETSSHSYHPVVSEGKNEDVPSLKTGYTEKSIIFCTDCHNNDNDKGPRGPHGSANKYLLGKNYSTDDFTEESFFNYELCYTCHERDSILDDESFNGHRKHIVDERTPCSACHDPHGVSSTQGDTVNNSHLINFDLTIVQPDDLGRLIFEDTGLFSGKCSLLCHGDIHDEKAYP